MNYIYFSKDQVFTRNILGFLLVWFFCVNSAAQATNINYQTQTISVDGQQYAMRWSTGFDLQLLNSDMQQPRLFSFDSAGNIIAGSRAGYLYRLKPPYTKAETLLVLPDYPHSAVVQGNELFIAQTSGLYKIDYSPDTTELDEDKLEFVAAIPGGYGHNSRTLKIGPDKKLYVSLGITGNCSDEYLHESYEKSDQRGGLMRLNTDISPAKWEFYASGLRNPVGFDWHPDNQTMYASNNGPDHHGYEKPREYFSEVAAGSFHGMPWFQYDDDDLVRDGCISKPPPRRDVQKPVATFPARNAPMDVKFIDTGDFGAQYHGNALVALHGSWGTPPGGGQASRRPPAIVMVRFENGKAVGVEDFISGFQSSEGKRLARPIGLNIGPDGALYFTSDGGINGLFRLKKNH